MTITIFSHVYIGCLGRYCNRLDISNKNIIPKKIFLLLKDIFLKYKRLITIILKIYSFKINKIPGYFQKKISNILKIILLQVLVQNIEF